MNLVKLKPKLLQFGYSFGTIIFNLQCSYCCSHAYA